MFAATGGVGTGGHTNHPLYSSQRGDAESAHLSVLQRPPLLVPSHKKCSGH